VKGGLRKMEDKEEAYEEFYPEQEVEANPNDWSGEDSDIWGGSEPPALGGIYALFEEVLNKESSIKVSNLDPKTELGMLDISVRDAMEIALIAKTLGHPVFAQFFLKRAGVITDSAMSKSGWLPELFVTSKKYAHKDSSASIANLPQNNNNKWNKKNKMFGGNAEQ